MIKKVGLTLTLKNNLKANEFCNKVIELVPGGTEIRKGQHYLFIAFTMDLDDEQLQTLKQLIECYQNQILYGKVFYLNENHNLEFIYYKLPEEI